MQEHELISNVTQKPTCLTETHFNFGKKYRGKVRDIYDLGDKLLLITTDRLSAFDKKIAEIPYKGQVLNLISAWWFEQTKDQVPNHFIAIPDPNALIAKKCRVFPIEFVVRGYITGTTSTSLWTLYQKGLRKLDDDVLPDNLKKNEVLTRPVITPTTKEVEHDRPISAQDIVREGWMTQEEWDEASQLALKLFQMGTQIAARQGLILVDTKYEFGRDEEGRIVVVDEIHTPDSSRYWLSNTYEHCMQEGREPDNIDKEFLRLWFVKNCNPYEDATLPKAPDELVEKLSSRYIQLYEMITGNKFVFHDTTSIENRIARNVAGYL